MADELAQAKDHLNAAAAALDGAEAPPDVGVTANTTHVEAVDLEPAADAARHISDNEVEMARISAEAAVEQASIAADVQTRLADGAAVEERLGDILERLGRLEGRAHDHDDEEEEDDHGEEGIPALLNPSESVETIEDSTSEDVPAAPDIPAEPKEPKEAKRPPRFYLGRRS